jgi:hypothetical protein
MATSVPVEMLQRVYAATDYLMELEGQDRSLVVEMSQAMLNDLINGDFLKPMIEYVKHYCDVYDSDDDAQRIADDI